MTIKPKKKQRNFHLDQLINEVTNKTLQIDYWNKENTDILPASEGVHQIARPASSAHTPSVKDKYHKRTARTIKTRLFDSSAKNKSSKLELSSFVRYLGYIRNAVRSSVARHNPELPHIIKELSEKYPPYTALLSTLMSENKKRVQKVKTSIIKQLIALDRVDADNLANELNILSRAGKFEHPIIKHLKPTSAQLQRLKEQSKKNLQERKRNKQSYSFEFISNVIDGCLDSDNFNELALGVSLATGRRAVEVVYRGGFKTDGINSILFSGQAKKGKGMKDKPYSIPTIIESARIVDAVERLRKTDKYNEIVNSISNLPDDRKNEAINTKCARMLNYTAKRLLSPSVEIEDSIVQYKNTRVIALQAAILKIMPTKKYANLDVNEFVLRFQGHDNYDEFANYQDIAVTNEPAPMKVIKKTPKADLSALNSADELINNMGKKTLWKLHSKVKALAGRTSFKLNQTTIYKGRKLNGQLEKAGGSLSMIKAYMNIPEVKEAIGKYNQSLSK